MFEAAAEALKLLADETRLRILWNLLHGEHSVNELADHLSAQPATVSHHLARLRASGAVRTRREGTRIFYSADNEHVEALVAQTLHHASHHQPTSLFGERSA
ncbi:MAG: metalloregulator ArsR/SmtB family transcription factor [Acidimicrobiales bacterium]|nr:metalloregulator ArsR/SmtB family transcription factor [Acidimicrobiales bacterium]